MPPRQSPRQAVLRRRQPQLRTAPQRNSGAPHVRRARATCSESLLPARYGQNNPATALGRKAWLFAGSDRGAERAAIVITLIMTARLNDIDPQAWLADTIARIAEIPQSRLHELLPWEWKPPAQEPAAAKAA